MSVYQTKKVIARFAAFNAIVVLIWWIATSFCPKVGFLTVESEGRVAYEFSCGRGLVYDGRGLETQRVIFPVDMDGCVHLSKKKTTNAACVRSFVLIDRFVRRFEWNPDTDVSECDFDTKDARFSVSQYALLGVAGLEVLLFLLSMLNFQCKTSSLRESVMLSASMSIFVSIIVPLQTYLGNPGCFTFGPCPFMKSAIAITLVTCGIMIASLECLRRIFGRMPFLVLTSVLVYGYLETGLLSIGCPALDGNADFYKDWVRGVLDISVFGVIIVLLHSLRRHVWLQWVPAVILVLSASSLLDVTKKQESACQSDFIDRFVPNEDVVAAFAHSPKKNVAVYILDSATTPVVTDVLSQATNIVTGLSGFTCYTNNIGMFDNTAHAVAGMLTGLYYDSVDEIAMFPYKVFSTPSVLEDYLKAGASVSFMPGSFSYGYSTRTTNSGAVASERNSEGHCESPMLARMRDQQCWNLYEIVRFRMTPFLFKFPMYMMTTIGWGKFGTYSLESWSYPRIAKAPIDDRIDLTFQFWHTNGPHPPLGENRHGVDDGVSRVGYGPRFEKTWLVLSRLVAHFDLLKKRGLYDNTFIVVAADHGSQPIAEGNTSSVPEANGRAFPLLMVKPMHSKGVFRLCGEPTSHAKIAGLLRLACSNDLSAASVDAQLVCRDRHFRYNDGAAVFDCDFANDRVEKTVLSRKSIDDLPTIRLAHTYRFGSREKGDPPILMTNVGRSADACMLGYGLPAQLAFRVPAANCEYVVNMRVALDTASHRNDATGCTFSVQAKGDTRSQSIRREKASDMFGDVRVVARSSSEGVITLKCETTEITTLLEIEVLER